MKREGEIGRRAGREKRSEGERGKYGAKKVGEGRGERKLKRFASYLKNRTQSVCGFQSEKGSFNLVLLRVLF